MEESAKMCVPNPIILFQLQGASPMPLTAGLWTVDPHWIRALSPDPSCYKLGLDPALATAAYPYALASLNSNAAVNTSSRA